MPETDRRQHRKVVSSYFVSRSSQDTVLVGLLVDLVEKALILGSDQIRCASQDGYRLRPGAQVDENL